MNCLSCIVFVVNCDVSVFCVCVVLLMILFVLMCCVFSVSVVFSVMSV